MTVKVGVLAPRMIDTDSLTGTTTDAYADALDWLTRGMGKKTIILANTDLTNSLTFTVLSLAVSGGNEAQVIGPAAVAAGDNALILLEYEYEQVIVQVKSTVAGNAATWQLDYSGSGASS